MMKVPVCCAVDGILLIQKKNYFFTKDLPVRTFPCIGDNAACPDCLRSQSIPQAMGTIDVENLPPSLGGFKFPALPLSAP